MLSVNSFMIQSRGWPVSYFQTPTCHWAECGLPRRTSWAILIETPQSYIVIAICSDSIPLSHPPIHAMSRQEHKIQALQICYLSLTQFSSLYSPLSLCSVQVLHRSWFMMLSNGWGLQSSFFFCSWLSWIGCSSSVWFPGIQTVTLVYLY